MFLAVFAVIDLGEGAKIDPEMMQDDAGVVGSKEILSRDVSRVLSAT